MLGQKLQCSCQMAGKVSQVSRRKHLDWTGIQIVLGILKLLKDRCISFKVAGENVEEDGCQLVYLTSNR
jgi:hypothetical protein